MCDVIQYGGSLNNVMIVLNVIDDAAQAELLKSISYLSHNKVYF